MRPQRMVCLAVGFAATWWCPPASGGEAPYAPKLNQPAPQFMLKTLDRSQEVILSKLRGQRVVVFFFASWQEQSRSLLIEWLEQIKPFVADGKLKPVGVALEQHADRCRLFAQWRKLDWLIAFDPADLVNVEKLPMAMCVDEYGIVRAIHRSAKRSLAEFASKNYPKPKELPPAEDEEIATPKYTRRMANEDRTSKGLMAHGEVLMLSGGAADIAEAIRTFGRIVEQEPGNAAGYFRMGVALRMRAESAEREAEDAAKAVSALQKAAALRKSNVVYQQRYAQLNGAPRPKPDYYDWIAEAKKDILARGETPIDVAGDPARDAAAMMKRPGDSGEPAEKGPEQAPPDGRSKR